MSNSLPEDIPPIDAEFLAEYLSNGNNGTKAAQAVRPELAEKPYTAAVWACRALARHKDVIKVILEQEGLTLALIANKISEGLRANKNLGSNGDGCEVPDYAVRHKYIETAISLFGLKDKQVQPAPAVIQTFNHQSQSSAGDINEFLSWYKQQTIKAIQSGKSVVAEPDWQEAYTDFVLEQTKTTSDNT